MKGVNAGNLGDLRTVSLSLTYFEGFAILLDNWQIVGSACRAGHFVVNSA
jgi:hypothetical protein